MEQPKAEVPQGVEDLRADRDLIERRESLISITDTAEIEIGKEIEKETERGIGIEIAIESTTEGEAHQGRGVKKVLLILKKEEGKMRKRKQRRKLRS